MGYRVVSTKNRRTYRRRDGKQAGAAPGLREWATAERCADILMGKFGKRFRQL
jgi:hypothetical protein